MKIKNRWLAASISIPVYFFGMIIYLTMLGDDHSPVAAFKFLVFYGFGLIAIFAGPIYFLPTIVGLNNRNSTAILVLNTFLGWTGIGWIAALIWAVWKEK